MAIYKPNNFYPRLQEVDLTNMDGNMFSCQVNTDGTAVHGADLKIFSEDNVLLYHNIYDFSKNPILNKQFLSMFIEPYKVKCEKYNADLTNNDDKIFILSDVSFINLNPDVTFDYRKKYCPYNFFNIKFKNSLSFGIKFIIDGKEFIYPFSIIPDGIEEIVEGKKYNIYVNIEELDLSIFETLGNDVLLETYICLLNDKDYYWDVQLYEHEFNSKDYKNNNEGTFLGEGYVTGSTKNVLWVDMDEQSDEVKIKQNEIKEDIFIDVIATSENSDLFEEQLKLERIDSGDLILDYIDNIENALKMPYNLVDIYEDNNINSNDMYLDINFNTEKEITHFYYRYAVINGKKYYDVDEDNNKKIYLSLDDCNSIKTITDKNGTSYTNVVDLIYTEVNEEGTFEKKIILESLEADEVSFKLEQTNLSDNFMSYLIGFCYNESQDTKEWATITYNGIFHKISNSESKICLDDSNYILSRFNNSTYTLTLKFYTEGETTSTLIRTIKYVWNKGTKVVTVSYIVGNNTIPVECKAPSLFTEEEELKYNQLIFFNKRHYKIESQKRMDNNIFLYFSDKQFINNFYLFFKNKIISEVKYKIILKQREKITWVTKQIGNNKNIYKIELENPISVNLNNNCLIDLYSGSNKNTHYTFFGVRNSDLNVDDIYVRFPGYIGSDFNNELINDCLKYYNEKGEFNLKLCNSKGEAISNLSTVGLKGDFYQDGLYYYNTGTNEVPTIKEGTWKNEDYQSASLYGKDISSKVFEKNNSNFLVIYDTEYIHNSPPSKNNFNEINFKFCTSGRYQSNRFEGCDVTIYGLQKYKIKHNCSVSGRYVNYQINVKFVLDESGYAYVRFIDNLGEDGNEKMKWVVNDTVVSRTSSWFSAEGKKININKIDYCFNQSNIPNEKKNDRIYYILNKDDTSEPTVVDCSNTKESFTSVKGSISCNYVIYPTSYCKLFKVTSYDYETGEFVIAGGLSREITNSDTYEIWERKSSEISTNEYNITEIDYKYTRLYPPSDKYDDIAYVGDTHIFNDIRIMNNTESQIFIQPNINLYTNEYNVPYLIFDNNNQRLNLNYNYEKLDNGFTIKDYTIDKLDGSQWLINYNESLNFVPKSGQFYKLYMDTCKNVSENWFFGRHIGNITLRVGEYKEIYNAIKSNIIKFDDFNEYKLKFADIEKNKTNKKCIIPYVDPYFMITVDNLTVPVKRYRYVLYDNNMNLIKDSDYIYDNLMSFNIDGFRNEETYLLSFEMEDQLGYIYKKEFNLLSRYSEYNINNIKLRLKCDEHQGCVFGDFILIDKSDYSIFDGFIGGNINNSTSNDIIERYCTKEDFKKINSLDVIYIYKRNKEKLLSYVCSIDLDKDVIIVDGNESKYGFIDYGIYNNEYYDYVAILSSDKISINKDDEQKELSVPDMSYLYVEDRCYTCFDGWILADLEKDDNDDVYYVKGNVWNFKYNLESNDLIQNRSVLKWDNLGKYANVYIGKRNYISSELTCLLGDVGTYLSYDGENIIEQYGYFEKSLNQTEYDTENPTCKEALSNNIDKYLEWKEFNNNGNLKLLKDYKGNIWIIQILENPTAKNNNATKEQMYTINFSWVEIADWRKYPILGKYKSNDDYGIIDNLLGEYWEYEYDKKKSKYYLTNLKEDADFSKIDYNNPLLIGGNINIGDSLVQGCIKNTTKTDTTSTALMLKWHLESNLSTYIDFNDDLIYLDLKSINRLCAQLKNLKGVNISFTDSIIDATAAFANTSISTDEKYQIQINTNNYINMESIFDNVTIPDERVITVKWGIGATDPDIKTYHELYTQYWDNPQIILDCVYSLKYIYDEDEKSIAIVDWIYQIDYENKNIILSQYTGNLKKVYVPANILINEEAYTVEYSPS